MSPSAASPNATGELRWQRFARVLRRLAWNVEPERGIRDHFIWCELNGVTCVPPTTMPNPKRKAVIATMSPSHERRVARALKLLVVIDASDASTRVLRYVAAVAGGGGCLDFVITCIAPHLPAELLEFGGSEAPEREQQLQSALHTRQRRWIDVAIRKPDAILAGARARLERAGVAASRIQTYVSSPLDARASSEEILLLAQEQQCSTVVVGHRAHPWYGAFGGGHLADRLIQQAKRCAVWVIN